MQNRATENSSSTESHANNPFVASYDIIDFLTTLAFVTTTLANSTSLFFPMISNVLHILNYSLLGYIQARDLTQLQQEELDQLQQREGNIQNEEQRQEILNELKPPKKGEKSAAEFAWDYAIYILKLLTCTFLITLSVISTAAVAGSIATFVNGALFPIGYVITTTINLLKFGKNFFKGIYDYFAKDTNGESAYRKHHNIIKAFESRYAKHSHQPHQIPENELRDYLHARNTINHAGRANIQNGIFFGLSGGFFAASILLLLGSSVLFTAIVPPVGVTVGGALFAGVGLLFAAHGISVLRNKLRTKRGLPAGKTFFGWLADKLYPTVNEQSLINKGLNYNTLPEPAEQINEEPAATEHQQPQPLSIAKPVAKFQSPTSSLLTSYGTTGFFRHAEKVISSMPTANKHQPTDRERLKEILEKRENFQLC